MSIIASSTLHVYFVKILLCVVFGFFLTGIIGTSYANECSSSFYEKAFGPSTHRALEKDLQEDYGPGAEPIFFSPEHLTKVVNQLNSFCCSTAAGVGEDEEICKTKDPDPVKFSAFMFDHLMSVYQYMLEYNYGLVSESGEDENLCKKKFGGTGCTPYIFTKNQLPSPAVCYRCGTACDSRCEETFGVGSGVDVIADDTSVKYGSQYAGIYEKFWGGEEGIIIPNRSYLIGASSEQIASLTLGQIGFHMCEEIKYIYSQLSSSSPLKDHSFNSDGSSYEQRCLRTVSALQRNHSEYIKTLSISGSTYSQKKVNATIRDHTYSSFADVANTLFDWQSKLLSIWKTREKFTSQCNPV